MTINNDDLIKYNKLGIIPGPTETEPAFLSRAAYCQQLQSQCTNDKGSPFPTCEETDTANSLLQEAFSLTKPLYDIAPTWLPLAFSNYHLAPWHGGCAWIFQAEENSPTGAFLQLRQGFRHNNKYLGLYSRKELVAHELAHVGRMTFEEKQFEEILAYRSSPQTWRRWLGPIIQSPWESMLFMLSLLLLLMFDAYLIFTGQQETYSLLLWAKLFPIGMIIAGLARVWLNQRTLKHCIDNLRHVCSFPDAVVYRLTDSEINKFSGAKSEGITNYAEEQSKSNLRWRLIKQVYFDH